MGYLRWILLSTVLAMIFAYGKLRNSRRNTLAAKLPGAPTLPLIGNGHIFFGTDMPGFVQLLLKLFKKYDTPQRVWLGHDLWVAVSKPKDIEAILTSENATDKCWSYNFFKCQADGIFVASGERWRKLRKLVNLSFHTRLLDPFLNTFNEQSRILIEMLEDMMTGEADVHPYVARCTLDIICGTQMGVKTHEQQKNTSDYAHNLSKSTSIVLKRIHALHLQSDFIFRLSDLHRKNQEYIKPMHKFAINGSDTTAVAISWTFLMMAIYPDIQEKAYRELVDIFGDSDRPCEMEDANCMKYTEMVIKESLRHYTIPGIVRIITKELNIENYTLPVGTNAYVSIYAAHRDPAYWQRPHSFYPEHFTPENVAARPKYSYMPFSMGPRNCPGNKFGMLSMKVIISQVLRRYKLTTSINEKDVKHTMSFMLESTTGYPVKLQSR